MQIYRIAPKQYLETYTGLGASYEDGARWNRPRQPVIYFSLSPATALLEMANYLPSPRVIPKNYHLGVYSLPDNAPLATRPVDSLPKDWATFPYPQSTQTIGGDWLADGDELGLIVPSAAVPEGLEQIIVVNPAHRHCARIKLIRSTTELFNRRIFSGL